jgi:hypothetical protein
MNLHKPTIRRPALARRASLAAIAAAASVSVLVTGCGNQALKGTSLGSPTHVSGTSSIVGPSTSGGSGLGTGSPRAGQQTGASNGSRMTQAQVAAARKRSGVTGGALFGGTTGLVKEESKLGRKLAIVRVYYAFGDKFPRPEDAQRMAGGRTLLLSLDLMSRKLNYKSVISGHYDGYLRTFLRAMNQAAIKYHLGSIYFCFEHEPNVTTVHPWLGTTAQFREAWDHIHRLAANAHLNWQQGGRLHWVMIMTHRAYIPMSKRKPWAKEMGSASVYFPGSNEVDLVAADGYDSIGCKPGRPLSVYANTTPDTVFDPIVSWAHAHGGIPVFLAEWGASAKVVTAQLKFIQRMPRFVTGNPQIAGTLYWDSVGSRYCTYVINNHPAAVVALRAMGQLAALKGRLTPA